MKENKIVELGIDKNYTKELDELIKEGWNVISAEPIEKIYIQIVGSRFVLQREKDNMKQKCATKSQQKRNKSRI